MCTYISNAVYIKYTYLAMYQYTYLAMYVCIQYTYLAMYVCITIYTGFTLFISLVPKHFKNLTF